MDGVVVVLAVVASVAGALMPALLLDIASFWPFLLLGCVAGLAVLALGDRVANGVRLIPPLFVGVWLGIAIALHFAAWSELPSAAGDMEGPEIGAVQTADLAIETSAILAVNAGNGTSLYAIDLARRGGGGSVPEALEALAGTDAVFRVREAADSFWFGTGGWELALAVGPAWSLDLVAPKVEADLRGLALDAVLLRGSGTLMLPTTGRPLEVTVSGDLTVTVPAGQPIEIQGSAAVPEGWITTGEGWMSPVEGEGILIIVESGSVEVTER